MSQDVALSRQMDMTKSTAPRMNLADHVGGPLAAMARVEERITFDARLRHLVKLRASQLNGCAFCLDMHHTEARADGESEARLAQLPAWAESPFFDDRERAALALTEAVTLLSETHVPDAVWEEAAAHFAPDELANLLFAIAAINTWNRLMVATRAFPASWTADEPAAA
jgi:AhpD family alkylhydroperoxidase